MGSQEEKQRGGRASEEQKFLRSALRNRFRKKSPVNFALTGPEANFAGPQGFAGSAGLASLGGIAADSGALVSAELALVGLAVLLS
jgi:hypothetical protein